MDEDDNGNVGLEWTKESILLKKLAALITIVIVSRVGILFHSPSGVRSTTEAYSEGGGGGGGHTFSICGIL